jgi:hypothetical protein
MAALGANGRIGARRYGPEAYVDAVLRCYATTVEQRASTVGDASALRAIAAPRAPAQP